MNRAAWILFVGAATAGAAGPDELPFARTLTPPDSMPPGDAVLAAELDSDVYAATRPDLGDLRVVTADGREVPYALQVKARRESEIVRQWHDATVQGLDQPADNRIAVTFALPIGAPPLHGIGLVSPLADFERQVRVAGQPADGGSWQTLVENALVVDYQRFADVRRTEIPVPENSFRRFRVEIDEVTDEQASTLTELTRTLTGGEVVETVDRTTYRRRPFRIDRLRWWSELRRQRTRSPVRTLYPTETVETWVDDETRDTVVELPGRREPLVSLTLVSPQANFSRAARVMARAQPDDGAGWQTLASGTLRHIAFRDLQESSLSLTFPEHRAEVYRLVIENRDSPPLEVGGVVASGTVYQVLFLAQGPGPYVLRYGDPDLAPPDYDEDVVLAPVQAGYTPELVAVGPQRTVGVYQPHRRHLVDVLNSPAAFMVMVVATVAILARLLVGLGRRV